MLLNYFIFLINLIFDILLISIIKRKTLLCLSIFAIFMFFIANKYRIFFFIITVIIVDGF